MARFPTLAVIGLFIVLMLGLNLAASHAQGPAPVSEGGGSTPVTAAFTYQGQLKRSGSPANTTCSFRFSLWTAATAGSQQGDTVAVDNVAVSQGLFTVRLNFGYQYFGDSRWLQSAVRCSGDANFTTLAPRTPLTAVPYAMSLRPGAYTIGETGEGSAIIRGENRGSGVGVWGETIGSSNAGVYGFSSHGRGVWGLTTVGDAGVYGRNDSGTTGSSGVLGEANQPGAFGVEGYSGNGDAGVYGQTANPSGSGVYGRASGGNAAGVYGRNEGGAGVWGYTPASASGAYGQSDGPGGRGVYGVATAAGGIGVRGQADGGAQAFGVYGSSTTNHGVGGFSYSPSGAGILGESPFIGVQGATGGSTSNAQGVRGIAPPGTDAWAGWFAGRYGGSGMMYAAGGVMQVDHPLDPANRTLSHAFVQSSEMLNIYDGVVTTDASGVAVVKLPAYVAAVNTDFRYQLTVIGQFAQAIVSEEIADDQFTIMTDKPHVKVSWQVTGVRNDPWAAENRVEAETWKPASERGSYLHPDLYDQPDSSAVGRNQLTPLHEPLESEALGAAPASLEGHEGGADQ